MPEHTSWLSFLPGYARLEEFFRHSIVDWGLSSKEAAHNVFIQHMVAALLVTLILLALSLRARKQLKAGDGLLPDEGITVRNLFEVAFEDAHF